MKRSTAAVLAATTMNPARTAAIPALSAALAIALLAATASPAGAIVKTIRTFQPVTVTPAHVSAQPAAIANNFCTKAGYGLAMTHTFIRFEIDNGTASALFEQITCNPNMAPLVFKRTGGLTLGQ